MQGQENEPLHLPSSMGLGDALNALFKSGSILILLMLKRWSVGDE